MEPLDQTAERHDPSDAELLFDALMEHLPEAVWIRDHEGHLVTANAASLELLNTTLEALRGTRAHDVQPGLAAAQWAEQDKYVIATGQPLTYEEDVHLPTGVRTQLTIKVPWQDAQGSRGIVGIARDITKRKALEIAERQARERLIDLQTKSLQGLIAVQESERERVGRSLHDGIGSGLSSLLFELDACAQGSSDEMRTRLLNLRARGENLMRALRSVSRGLYLAELEELGLRAALEQLCMEFTRVYGIPVDLDLAAWSFSLGPQFSKAIYRVVQEALENVAKHAGAKHVSIVATQLGQQLRLTVEDDGPGLQVEQRGMGQGLRSICERIRLLSGSTLLEETPEGGSTLHLQIPLERTHD